MGINSINSTITLIGRIFDTRQPVRPIYPDTSEKPPCSYSPIRQPFPRVSAEEVGISSEAAAEFFSAIAADETLNMHSILLLRNGKMIAEASFGDQDLRCWKSTFSACKSITSLAIGFLWDEGKIKLDEKLTSLFDSRLSPRARLAVKELTVRHLLTMTTGASFNEATMMTEPDYVKGYFAGTFSPGPFSYNSLNTYLLSAILREKTGVNLTEYLKPRLFDKLGIENIYWEKCPLGIEKGGWGLFIRPEDMAKLGQFVLQDGVWNGERLLSHEWLKQAAYKQVSTGDVSELYDYGFQMWTGRRCDSFLFNGMLGQNVLGFRENGVLLVSNAGNDELFQQSNYFLLAEKYFGQPMPDTLPENPDGARQLSAVIDSLHDRAPAAPEPEKEPFFTRFLESIGLTKKKPAPEKAPALPPECDELSGLRFTARDENAPSVGLMPVIWQGIQNNYSSGFRSVSFLRSGSAFYMTYSEEKESHLLLIGFGTAADSSLTFGGVPYQVKTLGEFTHDEDGIPLLKLRIDFIETPMTRYIKLYYSGLHKHLRQYERPGSAFIFAKATGLKQELVAQPIIGSTVNMVDDDYLRYRINKKFMPDITIESSAADRQKGTV